jgi:hypothetical protein
MFVDDAANLDHKGSGHLDAPERDCFLASVFGAERSDTYALWLTESGGFDSARTGAPEHSGDFVCGRLTRRASTTTR